METLTEEERAAALAICNQLDELRHGQAERDWPIYKHKKTGKLVKLMGTNKSWYFPSVDIVGVAKEPGKRHKRRVPVGALNFQRDYEPADALPATPAPAVAAECTCRWKAGHDNRCPAYDAYVAAMDETPAPAGAGEADFARPAASQLLDNRLKARYGFAEDAPLPWQNFTPKAVREEAILCIGDLLQQIGTIQLRLNTAVAELAEEYEAMADLTDEEEKLKRWIENELYESRHTGKADKLDLLIGRLQGVTDKAVKAFKAAISTPLEAP